MKLQNVLVALSLTSMTFAGVALAKGEKCYDKTTGQEVQGVNKAKECKSDKSHVWSKHAPKAAPAETKTSAPAGGTEAAPAGGAESAPTK